MRVALTFDTEPAPPGYAPDVARRVLDVLADRGIRATFFVQGEWAELHPDLAARLTAEGHRVANHTHTHARPATLSAEEFYDEIDTAQQALEHATGQDPRPFFRCPQNSGAFDPVVLERIAQAGYRQVGWTLDSFDWHEHATAQRVEDAVVGGVASRGDGSIVLLHSWPEVTADALPGIIDRLAERGAEFVTLDAFDADELPEATPMPEEPPFETYRLTTSTLWGLAARVATVVANFLVGVVIARALGPVGKGAYALVVQIVSVLVVVLGMGLATANVHYVARREVSARRVTANSIWLTLLTGTIATLVSLLFVSGPFAPDPPYTLAMALAAAALYVGTTLFAWLGAVAVGLSGLRPQAIGAVASVSLVVGGAVALWWTGALTPLAVVLLGAAGQLLAVAVVLTLQRGRMWSLRPSLSTLRRMRAYAAKSYLVNLVSYLHLRIDILVLGWLTTAATVGIYSVAVSMAEVARYAPTVISSALFARASQLSAEDGSALSARLSRLTALVVSVTAAVFALASAVLIPLLFGDAFAESVRVLYVLLPGVALIGIAEVPSSYLFSRGVIYWRASSVILALNIVLNLVLVPRMGAIGAALASTTTYAAYTAVILFLTRRTSGLPMSDMLLVTGDDVRVALSAVRRYARRG